MGIWPPWRVTGGTRPQNLAVRRIVIFNSTPSGNKQVGIHNRMGMQFASKLIGTLVVKIQLFKRVKGMCNIGGPTDAQKNGVENHEFCTYEFAGLHAAAVQTHVPPPALVQA
eukprot:1139457-Pelagomonas_calceolata.AAC.1